MAQLFALRQQHFAANASGDMLMITIEEPKRPDAEQVPQSVHGNMPLSDKWKAEPEFIGGKPQRLVPGSIGTREKALALAVRQALLMIVDAIEVYIGTEIRTAELRKRAR